ncbi:hypothetical protein IMZ30_09180 [Psychroflexus sp. ALD_RP9]|nr:hypothetical protein IMZ30_09180 [Psychroflexus sp. ALD_RP9]
MDKNHQVLVTEILPEENDTYGINVETRINGVKMATKLEHEIENLAESAFENFNQRHADIFFENLKKTMEE